MAAKRRRQTKPKRKEIKTDCKNNTFSPPTPKN
jgi:hypothetical protein